MDFGVHVIFILFLIIVNNYYCLSHLLNQIGYAQKSDLDQANSLL